MTPTRLSRLLTALCGLVFAGMMVALFALPYLGLAAELAGLAGLSYVAASILMIALPWHRRWELIRTVCTFAPFAAIARTAATGEWIVVLGVFSALIGVAMVAAPASIDRLRTLVRSYGDVSFDIIRVEEQRRDRRRRKARRARRTAAAQASAARESAEAVA